MIAAADELQLDFVLEVYFRCRVTRDGCFHLGPECIVAETHGFERRVICREDQPCSKSIVKKVQCSVYGHFALLTFTFQFRYDSPSNQVHLSTDGLVVAPKVVQFVLVLSWKL